MKTTERSIKITNVRFTSADETNVAAGLLGWVSLSLNGTVRLDGIAVRRTRENELTLSFPYRRDSAGRQHHIVRPLDDATHREIERQIIAALPTVKGGIS